MDLGAINVRRVGAKERLSAFARVGARSQKCIVPARQLRQSCPGDQASDRTSIWPKWDDLVVLADQDLNGDRDLR